MGVVLVVLVLVVFLAAGGWAVSRVMNFEVGQARKIRGLRRYVEYEDQDHPPRDD